MVDRTQELSSSARIVKRQLVTYINREEKLAFVYFKGKSISNLNSFL